MLYSLGLDGTDNQGDNDGQTFRGLRIDHNCWKSLEPWLKESGEDGEVAAYEKKMSPWKLDEDETENRKKPDDIAIRIPFYPFTFSAWPEETAVEDSQERIPASEDSEHETTR